MAIKTLWEIEHFDDLLQNYRNSFTFVKELQQFFAPSPQFAPEEQMLYFS